VAYGNPNGLNAALTPGAAGLNVTADVRDDALLTSFLQASSDLLHWSPLTWTVAANQGDVAAGFVRYVLQDSDNAQSHKFYRLELSY
jgi:hypothetical protein